MIAAAPVTASPAGEDGSPPRAPSLGALTDSLLEDLEKEEAWKSSPLGRDKPIPTLLLLEDCLQIVHGATPLRRQPTTNRTLPALFTDKNWGENPPIPSEEAENNNQNARCILEELKREVRTWEMEGGLSAPLQGREKFAEHLTTKYLCGALDPLPASYAVSRIRREAVQMIENLLFDDDIASVAMHGGDAEEEQPGEFPQALSAVGSFSPGLFAAAGGMSACTISPPTSSINASQNGRRHQAAALGDVPVDVTRQLRGESVRAATLVDGIVEENWGCSVCGKDNTGISSKCCVCGRLRGHQPPTSRRRGSSTSAARGNPTVSQSEVVSSRALDTRGASNRALQQFNQTHRKSESHAAARLSLSQEIKDLIGAIRSGGGSAALR
jgi:hypothetical protein